MTINNASALPRIPLNLWDHKLVIGLHWAALFISGGVLPVVLYFALRYGAHLKLSTVLGITTAIFGVVSALSLVKRTWALLKRSSQCRPLGATRWQMDYFNWNFMFGFVGVAVTVIIGNTSKNIRIVAMGLSILIIEVSCQLILVALLAAFNVPCPIRMSSVPRGDRIRSGAYAIAEDIVAVDGGQGEMYREQLKARYFASGTLRSLCFRLDIIWGVSGVGIGAATLALLFALSDANLAYILGWAIPWAYAAFMASLTIYMTRSALKHERADPVDSASPSARLMSKHGVPSEDTAYTGA